jgi:hypothetical protein
MQKKATEPPESLPEIPKRIPRSIREWIASVYSQYPELRASLIAAADAAGTRGKPITCLCGVCARCLSRERMRKTIALRKRRGLPLRQPRKSVRT